MVKMPMDEAEPKPREGAAQGDVYRKEKSLQGA